MQVLNANETNHVSGGWVASVYVLLLQQRLVLLQPVQ